MDRHRQALREALKPGVKIAGDDRAAVGMFGQESEYGRIDVNIVDDFLDFRNRNDPRMATRSRRLASKGTSP